MPHTSEKVTIFAFGSVIASIISLIAGKLALALSLILLVIAGAIWLNKVRKGENF